MAYKLNITEHADELLDNLVYHLIYRLKNIQAAKHLLDCIDEIYDRLEVNPFQFTECRDFPPHPAPGGPNPHSTPRRARIPTPNPHPESPPRAPGPNPHHAPEPESPPRTRAPL